MHPPATESKAHPSIFHVSSRQNIRELRDQVLRMHGFHVRSMVYSASAIDEVIGSDYDLVLIDVESEVRVKTAQEFCDRIEKTAPGQHVAFVCNYRVGVESDCPDEIIRAEFNPEALVRGVREAVDKNANRERSV